MTLNAAPIEGAWHGKAKGRINATALAERRVPAGTLKKMKRRVPAGTMKEMRECRVPAGTWEKMEQHEDE